MQTHGQKLRGLVRIVRPRLRLASARLPGRNLLLCLMIGAVGCSSSSLIEVSGEATLDGVPIEQGVIGFWPVDGKGPSAQARIEKGKYQIAVAPGNKKVCIEALQQVGETRPSGPSGPAVPVLNRVSPDDLADPAKTKLECVVPPADASNCNFQVTSS